MITQKVSIKEVLLSFSQKSTLQGGVQKHNNQPDEKLFIPIGQEVNKQQKNSIK